MNIILPIIGGIGIGLMFGVFTNGKSNIGITSKPIHGDVYIPNKPICKTVCAPKKPVHKKSVYGNVGTIGSIYIIKPGGVFNINGKNVVVCPEHIELLDGKWIPDGRNWKSIFQSKEWVKEDGRWKYVGNY